MNAANSAFKAIADPARREILRLLRAGEMTADAQALAAAAPTAQLLIVPGMNHVLKMVSGDLAQQMPSYGNPALAPALVDAVTTFVQQR